MNKVSYAIGLAFTLMLGGCAFSEDTVPHAKRQVTVSVASNPHLCINSELTLRDLFAAASYSHMLHLYMDPNEAAVHSYRYAEFLMRERENWK